VLPIRFELRQALRRIRRRPGYAAVVILTLALAVGANAAVFSLVDALLLRPLPFRDADRLVHIRSVRNGETGHLSLLEIRDLAERSATLADVASTRYTQYTLNGAGAPEAFFASINTSNLFDVLGARPMLGSTWPASDDGRVQYAVVLSHRLWQRVGGDPGIVGKTITLDSHDYTVLGVMPPGFTFPFDADIYRRPSAPDFSGRSVRTAVGVGRLMPGATPAQAQRELDAIAAELEREYPATNAGVRYAVEPLRRLWVGPARPYLFVLVGGVALVLVVATVTIAGLSLGQALARDRELAVRAALGAGRRSLAVSVLVEHLLLASAGGALGIVAGWAGLHALESLFRVDRPHWMAVALDGRAVILTVAVALAGGIAAALLPALHAAGIRAPAVLREIGAAGGRRHRLRHRRLAVAQVALAVVALVAAGLITRTLVALRSTDLGFRTTRLVTARIDPPWSRYSSLRQTAPFYRQLLEELGRTPGVEAATLVDPLPFSGKSHKHAPIVAGKDGEPERVPFVNLQLVSPGYFDALGIGLLSGRAFEPLDDSTRAPVAVVSAGLARRVWPGEEPLGKRIRRGDLDGNYNPPAAGARLPADAAVTWATVIGVVEDVRHERVDEAAGADLYLSNQQFFTPESHVVLRTRLDAEAAAGVLRAAVWRADPTQAVFDVRTMEDRLHDALWQQRLAGAVLQAFGAFAVGLAALGLYGVVAIGVAQRGGEIGLRMALGADPRRIGRMVLGEALHIAAVGVVLGVATALPLAWLARGTLHGVAFADPGTLVGTLAVIAVGAAAAGYLPARRAAMVDPMRVLRVLAPILPLSLTL
jgi:putative ABC transport system permease protein